MARNPILDDPEEPVWEPTPARRIIPDAELVHEAPEWATTLRLIHSSLYGTPLLFARAEGPTPGGGTQSLIIAWREDDPEHPEADWRERDGNLISSWYRAIHPAYTIQDTKGDD